MVHSTEQGLKLQLLAAALIAALVFLHYLLWIDENGVRQTHTLRISIRAQTEENAELAESNRGLAAEIEDLKRGLMAIEERARSDMGMIRQDETFYRLLEKSSKSTPPAKLPPVQLPPPAAKPALLPAKPSAQAAKPASAAKPPAPAAKPGSPASTAKPAPPGKPPAPAAAAKPAPLAKPQTPTAKPTPPAKPSAPASTAKPTPPAKPQTPTAKPTPPAKPQTPTAKPTPTPGASQRRE
jgi:cell division protein FtsB